MITDNVPMIGEWEKTLPRWKYFLYALCQWIPLVNMWALNWFGYYRAKRIPSLPRNAEIEWPLQPDPQMEPMNTAQIAKFIQDFFTWTSMPYHWRGPTCDEEAFLDWQCCQFHRQGLQEKEQFKQLARAIESLFPTFYQCEWRMGQPTILSQCWFERLSEVSGVPLPEEKMTTWIEGGKCYE